MRNWVSTGVQRPFCAEAYPDLIQSQGDYGEAQDSMCIILSRPTFPLWVFDKVDEGAE